MSIKVLASIAGASIVLTVLLFVFTSIKPSGSKNVVNKKVAEEQVVVEPPASDLNEPIVDGKGKIVGKVCVGLEMEKGVMVTAEKIPTKERVTKFIVGPIKEDVVFSLNVESGNYQIFSETPDRRKLGLYSQYVICGMDAKTCTDHSMIEVGVVEKKVLKDVNVCDYDWVK